MYSKEEAKALREEFWDSFNTMSARRRIRKKLPGNWNTRENGKSVSRIYVQTEGVDIYDRETWPAAHRFMYEKMMKLEEFFREYRDFLKYG